MFPLDESIDCSLFRRRDKYKRVPSSSQHSTVVRRDELRRRRTIPDQIVARRTSKRHHLSNRDYHDRLSIQRQSGDYYSSSTFPSIHNQREQSYQQIIVSIYIF